MARFSSPRLINASGIGVRGLEGLGGRRWVSFSMWKKKKESGIEIRVDIIEWMYSSVLTRLSVCAHLELLPSTSYSIHIHNTYTPLKVFTTTTTTTNTTNTTNTTIILLILLSHY
jgi:hypothetical protein